MARFHGRAFRMYNHAQFLQAILDQPEEDAPRLVYADWLEEQGDPRGEFIRIQCQLDALTEVDPDFRELYAREQQLLRKHKEAWLGPIADWTVSAKLYRGFCQNVAVGVRKFLKHRSGLFALAPIRNVNLIQLRYNQVQEVAACSEWQRVRGLEFSSYDLDAEALRTLFDSPFWTNLKSVALSRTRLCGSGLSVLAGLRCLDRVQRLNLTFNGLQDHDVESLLDLTRLKNLRELRVTNNRLSSAAMAILAANPNFTRLSRLILNYNDVGDSGLEALADSPHLSSLTDLSAVFARVSDRGVQALAESPSISKLTRLSLEHNDLRQSITLEALAERFPLRTLKVSGCHINDAGVEALARSEKMSGLAVLDLSQNAVTDRGARAILESPFLKNLVLLNLKQNHIDRDVKRALRRHFGPGVCSFSRW